ncbi:glycosyltransferase [Cellulosimicrobium sp. ES-005]|uniref:D-inositol 3-phosphate glycosyltransferase n=1 Tax=Cellulosimicrobium sp. ES-005 TaxID=3163031 RepID=A0AAU8G493_9MICO
MSGPDRGALRVAVTTGPVSIPPTYFVAEHLRHMPDVDGRVFAIAASVTDPRLRDLVTGVVPSGAGGWRTVLSYQSAVPRLRAQVRRFRPDLVHQHFATWSLAGAGAAADLGVPFLVTLHGYDVFLRSAPVRDVWSFLTAVNLRRCASRATSLLTVSQWLAGEAVRRGYPARSVEVQYQGVDTDFFTPGTPQETELPEILFVGGLEERKGIRDAIRASVMLSADVPHVLRVVGHGSLAGVVASAAQEHPHIRPEGLVDRERVRQAMRSAAVFVMPTQSDGDWREAAGLVTAEAQACGVPAVVYDSGGAPEMLVDGETGIVVPERDTRALADALRELLALDQRERAAMGARARRFVVEERDSRQSAAELRARYELLTH